MQASSSPVAVPGFFIQKVTMPLSTRRSPPTVMPNPGIPIVYVGSSAKEVQ